MPAELLFMPDYHADPIWHVATESMVSLDRLPISEPTRSAIRGWASRWEQLAEREMHIDDVDNGMLVGRAAHAWVSFEHEQRHVQWKPTGRSHPCSQGRFERRVHDDLVIRATLATISQAEMRAFRERIDDRDTSSGRRSVGAAAKAALLRGNGR